jgi:hypothetical protein
MTPARAVRIPVAFTALAFMASAQIVQANVRAQDMRFEGNPLWLIGIGAVIFLIFYLLIRGTYHNERKDRRKGRPDLDQRGGVFADLDDGDDDHHHFGVH